MRRAIRRKRQAAKRCYVAGVRYGRGVGALWVYRRQEPTPEAGFFYLRSVRPQGVRTLSLKYLPAGHPSQAKADQAEMLVSRHVRRWEARERARARWWTHAFDKFFSRLEIDLGTQVLYFLIDVPVEAKVSNDWWDEDLGLMAEYSPELAAFLADPEEYLLGFWARQQYTSRERKRVSRNQRLRDRKHVRRSGCCDEDLYEDEPF